MVNNPKMRTILYFELQNGRKCQMLDKHVNQSPRNNKRYFHLHYDDEN